MSKITYNCTLTALASEVNTPPEPEPAPTTLPAFDKAEFFNSIGGDGELAKDLLELFLEQDCPRLSTELQEAVASRDSLGVQSAAHGLKGLVGELYAQPAFDAALKLETIGREAELSNVETAYAILTEEIERLKGELATLVNKDIVLEAFALNKLLSLIACGKADS